MRQRPGEQQVGEYSPATGSRCSRCAKTSWKISAIQNTGIDTPRIAPALTTWSAARPGRIADHSPSGTPTRTAITSATMTSSSVAGAAVPRSDSTVWWVWIDTPQLPDRMPPK